ncbi:PR-1-like protein, partial [Tothia fuscella]
FLSDIDFRNAVMNSTSTVRRAHDASALNWNETLATVARARSESCRTKIDAASPFGEVIANKKPDVTRVVNSWASKAKIYDFDSPNAFLKAMLKKTEDAKSIFEFTELVWKNSTQIGCARKDCTKPNSKVETNFLVICELYPKGNVVGRFKENVQANVDGMENG